MRPFTLPNSISSGIPLPKSQNFWKKKLLFGVKHFTGLPILGVPTDILEDGILQAGERFKRLIECLIWFEPWRVGLH